MATIKKCDRCGKTYERNMYETGILRPEVYITGFRKIWNDGDISGIVNDLCDDCQKKLDEFMKGDNHEKA